jgi:hypothetical protein
MAESIRKPQSTQILSRAIINELVPAGIVRARPNRAEAASTLALAASHPDVVALLEPGFRRGFVSPTERMQYLDSLQAVALKCLPLSTVLIKTCPAELTPYSVLLGPAKTQFHDYYNAFMDALTGSFTGLAPPAGTLSLSALLTPGMSRSADGQPDGVVSLLGPALTAAWDAWSVPEGARMLPPMPSAEFLFADIFAGLQSAVTDTEKTLAAATAAASVTPAGSRELSVAPGAPTASALRSDGTGGEEDGGSASGGCCCFGGRGAGAGSRRAASSASPLLDSAAPTAAYGDDSAASALAVDPVVRRAAAARAAFEACRDHASKTRVRLCVMMQQKVTEALREVTALVGGGEAAETNEDGDVVVSKGPPGKQSAIDAELAFAWVALAMHCNPSFGRASPRESTDAMCERAGLAVWTRKFPRTVRLRAETVARAHKLLLTVAAEQFGRSSYEQALDLKAILEGIDLDTTD